MAAPGRSRPFIVRQQPTRSGRSRRSIGLSGHLISAATSTNFLVYPPVSKSSSKPRPKIIQCVVKTGLRPMDGCEWLSNVDPGGYGTNESGHAELPPAHETELPKNKRQGQTENDCRSDRYREPEEPVYRQRTPDLRAIYKPYTTGRASRRSYTDNGCRDKRRDRIRSCTHRFRNVRLWPVSAFQCTAGPNRSRPLYGRVFLAKPRN